MFKLVADSVDKRLSIYTPENLTWHLEMNPWKGDSSWKPPFLASFKIGPSLFSSRQLSPKNYTWSFPLPRYFLREIWAKWEAKLTPKAGWLFKLKNSGATVDGSEIRRSPVEVVGSLSYYLGRFFLHPNCGCLGFLNHPQYRKVWGLNRTQNFEFLESYKTAGRFSQQEKLMESWQTIKPSGNPESSKVYHLSF